MAQKPPGARRRRGAAVPGSDRPAISDNTDPAPPPTPTPPADPRLVNPSRAPRTQRPFVRGAIAAGALGGALCGLLLGPPPTAGAQPASSPALEEARRLAAEGRIEEAAARLEQLRADDPADPAALWMLAVARLRLGAFAEAAALAGELAALTPGNPNGPLLRGTALRELGRFADAEAALREAVAREPSHPEARRDLALVLAAQGRREEAVAALESLRAEYPRRAEVLAPLGVLYVQTGRGAEGLAALTGAATSDPSSFEAQHHLGALHSRLASYPEAGRRLDAALALRPGDPGTLLEICLLRSREERLEDAEAACARAVAAAPENAEAHFRSGDVLHYLREDAAAEAAYRETLAREPDHRRARFRLGLLLHETGRSADAAEVLRPALPLPAAETRGAALLEGGEAREQEAGARVTLGLALAGSGEQGAAVLQLRAAAAVSPLTPEPHLHLGNLLARSGEAGEAAAGREHLARFAELKRISDRTNELKAAINARPGAPEPKRALIAHLIGADAAFLAVTEAERLLTLAAAEPVHHLLYAESLAALGEAGAARAALDRALADWPEHAELREAAARLAPEP